MEPSQNISQDISSEELQVFLQDAEEQLQLLDEDIVRLETEQDNPEILQEIFRAAHTIKGSSAMLGHPRMAALAHAMESTLDSVRNGKLGISTQLVDALLQSLDVLKTLKEDLATSRDSTVDIARSVDALERMADEQGRGAAQVVVEKEGANALGSDQEASQRIETLLASGKSVYQIKVALNRETPWAAIRCFQVLNELSDVGEVLASDPSQQEIEEEKVGYDIRVTVASWEGEDALKDAVASLDEIHSVEIIPYTLDGTAIEPTGKSSINENGSNSQKKSRQSQTVRIDVERLDRLMNTIGELAVDRTSILQIGQALESRYKNDDLAQALGMTSSHFVKVVDELQEEIMKARMLPIETLFSGFSRLVRDQAQNANKKVNFVIEGQETEIDRTVIDHIRDPLVHVLRNAVDHGIEKPEQRKAAGKPETGILRLSAYHEQGYIVITIEDDGRGIDAQLVRNSAVNKGLISAELASTMSDAEAIDLVFTPGASTAEEITEISGRGVGMDIARTNVEAIHGSITLDTKVKEGTRVTFRLPLTLATLQSMLVTSAQTVYAVPLVYVVETVKLQSTDIQTITGTEVIKLRGSVMPLLQLRTELGMGAAVDPSDKTFVVVVQVGERLIGLAVESLMGIQEITLKSLGGYMGAVRGIAGATILGDGRVALILDVPTLVKTAKPGATLSPDTSLGD